MYDISLVGFKNPSNPQPDAPVFSTTIHEGGDGSAASPSQALEGEPVTLNAGTRTGFTFSEWRVDAPESLSITYNSFTMPGGNVNVTALWKAGQYGITITQGGGTGSAVSKDLANGGDEITLTRGTYEGHGFIGWTVVSPDGLLITNGSSGDSFVMPATNVELTAVWVEGKYKVWLYECGEGSEVNPELAEANQPVTLKAGTRVGHKFTGWTVTSPEGVTVIDNSFTMPHIDVSVTATWASIPYAITVNSEQNVSSASPNPANFGQTVTLNQGTLIG